VLRALATGTVVAAVSATLLTGRFFELDGAIRALAVLPALLTGASVASAMFLSATNVPGRILWPVACLLSAGSLSLGLVASLASGRSVSSDGLGSLPAVYTSMLVAALIGVYVGRMVTLRVSNLFSQSAEPSELLPFPIVGYRPHTTLHTTDISWLVQRLQRFVRRGRRG
jgi:hypothetical protein